MNLYKKNGFLTPSECEAAIKLFPPPDMATTNNGSLDPRRRGKTAFLPPCDHSWLIERVRSAMMSINARLYRFDLDDIEPVQLAHYHVDDKYDQHLDIGPGSAELRKLSATVQLSDSDSYDGGDLEIWGTGKVQRQLGTLAIFPSYLVHSVSPVTRGIRMSLVAWATGKSSFK